MPRFYVSTSYLQNSVTAYSIEAWVKTTSTGGGVIVQDRGDQSGKSVTLMLRGDGYAQIFVDSANLSIGVISSGPSLRAFKTNYQIIGNCQIDEAR